MRKIEIPYYKEILGSSINLIMYPKTSGVKLVVDNFCTTSFKAQKNMGILRKPIKRSALRPDLVLGLISDAFIYYFTSLVSVLQLMCKYFAFFGRPPLVLLLTDIKYI